MPAAPAASLTPASVSVDIAHDGAPVDLTSTPKNTGGGTLTWHVGSVRDVSAATAPAVAAGPIATARIYDKAHIENTSYVDGEIIVGVKEAAPGSAADRLPIDPGCVRVAKKNRRGNPESLFPEILNRSRADRGKLQEGG